MIFYTAGGCPHCSSEIARAGNGEPWCPSCLWNLSAYDPEAAPPFGWKWFEELSHRLAYRLDQSQYERFRTKLPSIRPQGPGRTWLRAVSVVLWLAALASALLAGWLIVDGFPSWWIILGLTLIPVAVLVRPRPGRAPRSRARLRREQAPSLFALVERVADRVGTAAPDMIVLDHRFEAGIVRLGWRRRAVLRLGAPLWLCLDPGMRVALLAHELAHDVNADPERGRFVEPALNTIRRLAVGSEADRSIDEILNGNKRRRPSMVADIARMGLWLANRVFLLVHLAVVRVGAGDHQRAEYFADWVSAKVAGTAATQRLLDQLLLGREIVSTVEHNAHRIGPQRWRQLAAELEAGAREQLQLLRQFSRRSTSMWDRHPPHGLRAELVGFWPNQPAGLVLTQAASDHIDRDLAFWFTGYHRRILGTRMFQESAEGLASG